METRERVDLEITEIKKLIESRAQANDGHALEIISRALDKKINAIEQEINAFKGIDYSAALVYRANLHCSHAKFVGLQTALVLRISKLVRLRLIKMSDADKL